MIDASYTRDSRAVSNGKLTHDLTVVTRQLSNVKTSLIIIYNKNGDRARKIPSVAQSSGLKM